ncbi:MAG: glycosyltransferase family 4 protein [Patescibacteria group bacterium]|nr:glycosyltransferase family 4 protein [Patescibacteria group bacterium]
MRVAIDSGPTLSGHSVRGVGTYAKELINNLKKLQSKAYSLNINAFDFSRNSRLIFTDYDVVHFTAFSIFERSLPFRLPENSVVTIHDMIPLIYPRNYPGGIRGNINWQIQKKILKKAKAIIANSETTKKDIIRFTDIDPQKVHVTHLSYRSFIRKISKLELPKIRKKLNLPARFVLYVGDVNYNKNLVSLVKACQKIDIPLVICGKAAAEVDKQAIYGSIKGFRDHLRRVFNTYHPEIAHLKNLIEEFSRSKNVYRLGYVEDKTLNCIYNLATVYCQPSYYEGFGMPVAEAMSVGTPVVCAKTQALVEVAGKSAVYFDPHDVDDLVSKLSEVLCNSLLRSNMIKEGLKISEKYSWGKTALDTLKVYNLIQK